MLSRLSKVVYLDTERENGDINVVQQANIPYVRKLDDTGTSLRLFESFFVDVLVNMIGG